MARRPARRLSRRQREQIRDIRAKHYSPAYEKRLIRGVEQGKSRQQSRGHKAHEHVERKERERSRQGGLSTSEIRSIRNFYERWRTHSNFRGMTLPRPNVDRLIEWTQENGYDKFVEYRNQWSETRRAYEREKNSGTYSDRGEGYLDLLLMQANAPDVVWYFYH